MTLNIANAEEKEREPTLRQLQAMVGQLTETTDQEAVMMIQAFLAACEGEESDEQRSDLADEFAGKWISRFNVLLRAQQVVEVDSQEPMRVKELRSFTRWSRNKHREGCKGQSKLNEKTMRL